MADFFYRTEDIKDESLLDFFVATQVDERIVEALKSPTPVILEGSRGTGKSFLMKVAQIQLDRSFSTNKILPVYVTFLQSSLIHTKDPHQFRHWMLAKMYSRLLRALSRRGLLPPASDAMTLLNARDRVTVEDVSPLRIEKIYRSYEDSWNVGSSDPPSAEIPTVDDAKDAIEDICRQKDIRRIIFFSMKRLTCFGWINRGNSFNSFEICERRS